MIRRFRFRRSNPARSRRLPDLHAPENDAAENAESEKIADVQTETYLENGIPEIELKETLPDIVQNLHFTTGELPEKISPPENDAKTAISTDNGENASSTAAAEDQRLPEMTAETAASTEKAHFADTKAENAVENSPAENDHVEPVAAEEKSESVDFVQKVVDFVPTIDEQTRKTDVPEIEITRPELLKSSRKKIATREFDSVRIMESNPQIEVPAVVDSKAQISCRRTTVSFTRQNIGDAAIPAAKKSNSNRSNEGSDFKQSLRDCPQNRRRRNGRGLSCRRQQSRRYYARRQGNGAVAHRRSAAGKGDQRF